MAWRFRKSARLPLGFRLNASKSGLGFSWGFRGFRIGRDAKGRIVRTISVPGTGLYNRQVVRSTRPRGTFVTVNSQGAGYQQRLDNSRPGLQLEGDQQQVQLDSVFQVPVAELSASNQSELIRILNENVSAFNPTGILCALSLLALLLVARSPILGLILCIFGLVLAAFVSKHFVDSHTEDVVFSLDPRTASQFEARQQALSVLASCSRVWVVNSSASNVDAKHNAGAYTLISRGPAAIGILPTKGFKCSLPISSIRANNIAFHFLPDQVLIYSGRYASISYAQLSIEEQPTQYRETESIPPDSRRIGSTWQYVNKSGGPDRRFKNNQQIPILEYGKITFRTGTGLQVVLQTSNSEKARVFALQFLAVQPSSKVPSTQPAVTLPAVAPDHSSQTWTKQVETPVTLANSPSEARPASAETPTATPVGTSSSPEWPSPKVETQDFTQTDFNKIAVEVNSALDELTVPLKEELRQYRVAGSARDLLEGEITKLITRTGFDGAHYSPQAVDLNLCILRQTHPKRMHLFEHATMARFMDEMIQKNRDYYLPQKMKPDVLQHLESFDGKHGTQFAARAAEMFLRVAAAAATEDGTISEAKRQILDQMAFAFRS